MVYFYFSSYAKIHQDNHLFEAILRPTENKIFKPFEDDFNNNFQVCSKH